MCWVFLSAILNFKRGRGWQLSIGHLYRRSLVYWASTFFPHQRYCFSLSDQVTTMPFLKDILLEVIIDYGSALKKLWKQNRVERSPVSRPRIKTNRG